MSVNAQVQVTDVTSRLNNLKGQIEKGKVEKTRAETNLAMYVKQKEEIVAQLAELGVTPEGLDAELERLDQEITDNLAQAEELIGGQ